jgi:hypothetical protein
MPSTRARNANTLRRSVAFLVVALLASACGADRTSAPQGEDAYAAANIFTQMSDSVRRAGGDSSIASAYSALADAVRKTGRVSPVTITIDGVATAFMATAEEHFIAPVCPACASPIASSTLHTLLAWAPSDPRRIVQIVSTADVPPTDSYYTLGAGPLGAAIAYFDEKGGAFLGMSATRHFSVSNTKAICASSAIIQMYPPMPVCTNADFIVDFAGVAEASQYLISRNPATGSHTLSMASQPVAGVRIELTTTLPPPPPITTLPPLPLAATLGVKTDSLVTFTLTVSNSRFIPELVQFTSGQHSDFSVYDKATGARIWNSSMGVLFTQVVSVDTISTGGQRVYTAQWSNAPKGTYTATGSLVSRSHSAQASAQFTVP